MIRIHVQATRSGLEPIGVGISGNVLLIAVDLMLAIGLVSEEVSMPTPMAACSAAACRIPTACSSPATRLWT